MLEIYAFFIDFFLLLIHQYRDTTGVLGFPSAQITEG